MEVVIKIDDPKELVEIVNSMKGDFIIRLELEDDGSDE